MSFQSRFDYRAKKLFSWWSLIRTPIHRLLFHSTDWHTNHWFPDDLTDLSTSLSPSFSNKIYFCSSSVIPFTITDCCVNHRIAATPVWFPIPISDAHAHNQIVMSRDCQSFQQAILTKFGLQSVEQSTHVESYVKRYSSAVAKTAKLQLRYCIFWRTILREFHLWDFLYTSTMTTPMLPLQKPLHCNNSVDDDNDSVNHDQKDMQERACHRGLYSCVKKSDVKKHAR